MMNFKAVTALAALASIGTASASNASLPIVDLGYELHQASVYNVTGQSYNFSNIRYAAPPLGELRFAKPQAPAVNRTTVQTGTVGRICPQATPAWEAIAAEWIPEYFEGKTSFNESSFASTSNGSTSIPAQDPRTTEDCLFLDVVVPKQIFDTASSRAYGAPVLVWIYGGGATMGSKDGSGNPAGLIARSENNNSSGVIYVSMNYRLGAFGFLSGPTFQENGTANLGLYDQRLALDWVQQNIHLFGGDPNRVTVFGESAGGASILHQITAYGGAKGPAPFSQAVLQSPGFEPMVSPVQQEEVFQDFLALLNVSTIEEARKLPTSALQLANIYQVGESTYGTYTYGPVVDGEFVPALPGVLLSHGQYDTSVHVMVGHNADEGLLFTDPFVNNNTAFDKFIVELLPTLAGLPKTVDYIANTLYPPIFDGSQAQGYTTQIARVAAIISEVTFVCNTFYLDKAYGNDTYAYYFTIPPALHGYDIAYTYYNANGSTIGTGASSSSVIAPAIAIALQEYITHFAETGNPNEQGVPYFPIYGQNNTVDVLNITGIREAADPAANYRCDWWQKGLYY